MMENIQKYVCIKDYYEDFTKSPILKYGDSYDVIVYDKHWYEVKLGNKKLSMSSITLKKHLQNYAIFRQNKIINIIQ